jgi:hypothetical protein
LCVALAEASAEAAAFSKGGKSKAEAEAEAYAKSNGGKASAGQWFLLAYSATVMFGITGSLAYQAAIMDSGYIVVTSLYQSLVRLLKLMLSGLRT